MIGRLQQLWTRRKPVITVAVVIAGTVLLLGAIRYSHRTPAIPTIDVKRGEFLDSFEVRGEITALKSIGVTAPAEAGDLQILKLATDGAKVKQGDSIVEFDKTKTEQFLQGAKRIHLTLEGHDPRMRARAHHRNVEAESGERIAGADAASDVGGSRAEHAGFRRVRTARAKFHYAATACRVGHARSFSRD